MTFSIVGRDARTGMLGVAVATKHWAVGSRVPYMRPRLAAMAVQAYAQPYIGYDVLKLMSETGCSGSFALSRVLANDPGREWRQVGIVDAEGQATGFTGSETEPWSGHLTGSECVAAGNMLAGAETVQAMVNTYERTADEELPERLVAALRAGHLAGGDRRGQQSAALYVVYLEEAPYLDLRVDDHPEAVTELMRLVTATHDDALTRSLHFATRRDSWPISEYRAHKEQLRRIGLA